MTHEGDSCNAYGRCKCDTYKTHDKYTNATRIRHKDTRVGPIKYEVEINATRRRYSMGTSATRIRHVTSIRLTRVIHQVNTRATHLRHLVGTSAYVHKTHDKYKCNT